MLRKGRYKYIYTHGHPPLLFDLVDDPNEQNDIASSPASAPIVSALHDLAMTGWDPDDLTRKVLESQVRRKLIKTVPGQPPSWDFLARDGDDKRYVRADGVDATKSRLRLPQVPEAPPDWPALSKETVADLIAGKRSIHSLLK